ncbi:hypothetical protein ABZ135_30565 [Streptomyces sp. NPDC006339]|uniref:hypothetical protein n=1 Tax=Streptomyces sp. NPDC006339 TaxID=3156755 RepID=UPI0033B6BB6F
MGTAVLLAAAPAGRGRAMDAASVLPALAAVPAGALAGTDMATVVELADPLDPQAVLTRLRSAAAAPGPLALYLAGQLQLDRRQRLPHLALARSTPTTLRYTGLPWHWLAAELAPRRPGTTTVVADLAVDPEIWQRLAATPDALALGPAVPLFARVTPFPRRGALTTPDYLRHFATLWRTGARPPFAALHAEAAAAAALTTPQTETIFLSPPASPQPQPLPAAPPVQAAPVALLESPPTHRLRAAGPTRPPAGAPIPAPGVPALPSGHDGLLPQGPTSPAVGVMAAEPERLRPAEAVDDTVGVPAPSKEGASKARAGAPGDSLGEPPPSVPSGDGRVAAVVGAAGLGSAAVAELAPPQPAAPSGGRDGVPFEVSAAAARPGGAGAGERAGGAVPTAGRAASVAGPAGEVETGEPVSVAGPERVRSAAGRPGAVEAGEPGAEAVPTAGRPVSAAGPGADVGLVPVGPVSAAGAESAGPQPDAAVRTSGEASPPAAEVSGGGSQAAEAPPAAPAPDPREVPVVPGAGTRKVSVVPATGQRDVPVVPGAGPREVVEADAPLTEPPSGRDGTAPAGGVPSASRPAPADTGTSDSRPAPSGAVGLPGAAPGPLDGGTPESGPSGPGLAASRPAPSGTGSGADVSGAASVPSGTGTAEPRPAPSSTGTGNGVAAPPPAPAPASAPVTVPPRPTHAPGVPGPGGGVDPHPAILEAAMAGRHGEAAAMAAAWESDALRRYGPRSSEAVHWVEVRADLARLAGEPARSCELWIAAAQARLGMRQGPDEPDVEGAVDRAHHQWEQIRDPARARALGPALVELRRAVPGRRAGALAALQRRLG